jgi:hypothetical protein
VKSKVFLTLAAALVVSGLACSTGSSGGARGPNATAASGSTSPAATPTPSWLARTNPNIVEEDDVHFVERYPKKETIRADERHFRLPISPQLLEFYREDDDYYYVYRYKRIPELEREKEERLAREKANPESSGKRPVAPLADFADVTAPRVASNLRFEELKNTGLPRQGLWRASFVIADMNGDGIPDIVAPPARLGGEAFPHVWLGDGQGHYKLWNLTFTENGKPVNASVDYGGIAVGDIDGDGHMDIVCASHNGGLLAFFGDGKGNFEVSRQGLPLREFSAQAVALVDVDGDGRLDIVASKDVVDPSATEPIDLNQVRVYLYKPGRRWEFRSQSLSGAAYSYSLTPWDFDGDGVQDILTGSHYYAAQILLWKNGRKGAFSPVAIPAIESHAFHYRTAPGTWGPAKRPAFAETFMKYMQEPPVKAVGVNVYSMDASGEWSKHVVFRKKDVNPFLYAVGYGDVDGDGRDDVIFPDSDAKRIRIFLQQADGSFAEIPEAQEPPIDSPAQCVRLLDVDRDGRVDIVVAKTVSSTFPDDPGGWSIYRKVR